MNFNSVFSPSNHIDFENYYYFRWKYLRKNLNQKLGSEKDDIEDISIHRMLKNDNHKIIGVGRLHKISCDIYQIRYFAIHKDYRRIGAGRYLMNDLERIASDKEAEYIKLNSREDALNFYTKLGYNLQKKTNLLYGKIQHYEMIKKII